MKEIITIEQFDNGITIKATNEEGNEWRVVLELQKEQELGKMIWETIRFLMDKQLVNTVAMEIEYKAINYFEKLKINQ